MIDPARQPVNVAPILASLAQCLSNLKFDGPVYIVERGAVAGYTVSWSGGEPHTDPYSLLCQFQGGLKPENVLYIGTDKELAEKIYHSQLAADNEINELMQGG